jgi:hypothetical protein
MFNNQLKITEMEKSIYLIRRFSFAVIAVVLCLLPGSMFVNVQAQAADKEQTTSAVSSGENSQCRNLADFLRKEYVNKSKPDKDRNIRMIGVKEENAFSQALKVCEKLKAQRTGSENDDLIYELPGGLGRIVLHEVYQNDIFVRLTFVTGCTRLPFTELWYVSLEYYNKQ